MSQGVKAYELSFGKYALRSDIVNNFDYEENNLTNSPEALKDFYLRWVASEISEDE